MASEHSRSASTSSSIPGGLPDKIDPVLRNTLRYTVSAREYKLLHEYLISRAPAVQKRAPQPRRYEAIVKSKHGGDDFNAAAIRAALRVGIVTWAGLKGWDFIREKLAQRSGKVTSKPKVPFHKAPNVRLSSSLSFILLFHRLLFRFFTRLRASLLAPNAQPFRRRNPRISKGLTSRFSPAVGASLAGFFLAVFPASELRVTIAIYVFARALEFLYNGLDLNGYLKNKPWWFGSWLLFPFSSGQLLYAFVFDRDCFPENYGKFILKHSPEYIQQRPKDYPLELSWPSTTQIVDSLAEISRMKWPSFTSPILYPNAKTFVPSTLSAIQPITSPAHPAIKSLSCALLHPNDPSCMRTYLTYHLRAIPSFARFFALIYAAFSIPKYKSLIRSPIIFLNNLAKQVLKGSTFAAGAVGTSWASICFFQSFLPGRVLPTQRWFLGGFLGGLWAMIMRRGGRGVFLYSSRLSALSLWKVGIKKGWWRGNGILDVLVFVIGLIGVNVIFEAEPKTMGGGLVNYGVEILRGDANGIEKVEEVLEKRKEKKASVESSSEADKKSA